MLLDYQIFEPQAKKLLKKIAKELNTPGNIDHAYRVTQSVFNAIRDIVKLEDSLALIAELPDDFRRMYSEEWDISADRLRFDTAEQFYQAIREASDPESVPIYFHDNTETRQAVQAVFKALHEPTTQKVLDRVRQQLPPLSTSV